uniref:BTB domain-containing protein n=1 Tax=Denticeps clupeoides TaxID=299321 RepID=A0AAY4DLA2_9TELE
MGSGTIKEGQDDCRIKDNFCSGPSHAEQVLQILNLYRQSGSFTDVVLQVEEKEFPCHRAVLSASSSYFRTMFSSQLQEQHQHLVQMNGISSTALEVVLNFMYEGLMNINEGNVAMVFQTADLLDVTVLRKVCIQFLEKQVDHSNCLGLMDFASFYTLTPLAEQCQKMLFQNFTQVYQHEEFTSLPKDRVKKLLSSEQMQVQSEEVLVKAVLKWVHHKPTSRKGELKELLELVHLPLLDPVFLLNSVESDSIVQDCPECRPLILEARRYHMFGREVHSHRTKPRRSSDRAEMIVVIGGCDRNGFSRLSFTEMFKPTSNEWMSGASIPGYSKSEFACCEFQNDVLVSGSARHRADLRPESLLFRE